MRFASSASGSEPADEDGPTQPYRYVLTRPDPHPLPHSLLASAAEMWSEQMCEKSSTHTVASTPSNYFDCPISLRLIRATTTNKTSLRTIARRRGRAHLRRQPGGPLRLVDVARTVTARTGDGRLALLECAKPTVVGVRVVPSAPRARAPRRRRWTRALI